MRILDRKGKILWEEVEDQGANRPEVERPALRNLLLDSLQPGTIRWGQQLTAVNALKLVGQSRIRLLCPPCELTDTRMPILRDQNSMCQSKLKRADMLGYKSHLPRAVLPAADMHLTDTSLGSRATTSRSIIKEVLLLTQLCSLFVDDQLLIVM